MYMDLYSEILLSFSWQLHQTDMAFYVINKLYQPRKNDSLSDNLYASEVPLVGCQ